MGQTIRPSSKKLIKEDNSSTLVIDFANYQFQGGYPTEATIQRAYDEADLYRAVQAYKFFYPTVSGAAIFVGNKKIGIEPNKTFGTLDTKPMHVGFTLNSDTPYGPIAIDLSAGPMVVDIPAGPLIVVALDINQRWVADMGIPGPDGDKGGKFLLLPPNYTGDIPAGYHVIHNTTNQIVVGVRSLPVNGDVAAALERIKTVKVYPLHTTTNWEMPTFADLTPKPQDTTPLAWENNFEFWNILHEVINKEPAVDGYRNYYGDLAALGIEKGKPFEPDAHKKAILEKAAKIANAQMRVQSFADRRPDRIVWPDRQWEWAALRFEDGDFNTTNYVDLDAREKWFYQAIGSSPAMFRRGAGSGSVYWLGVHDKNGQWLMGDNTYKLTVPTPVPGKLFWSVTIYDTQTRSQIITDQGKAALRSLFELKGKDTGNTIDLFFGPTAPNGKEGEWIQTIPGKGWFTYFRVYGPETSVFDGSWKPGDFEIIK
ncbi:hypothetical protein A4H97_24015 [Niastella yeongjuensis]|uniref:DUF1254 domain-containing protein n=1 Tax=Niastella yeongjuensis TaxID=354355 RepID=A0A1V9F332_9BACT|nr:DUF1254 domain-containing protein [Niastella yeongjuensis]OQP52774.1 hypothetical protein A4H97_24015 [Niastella yeongjuensis]SEP19361.1 Uncharacterized conserved protein [Niastella yeongjuensis]